MLGRFRCLAFRRVAPLAAALALAACRANPAPAPAPDAAETSGAGEGIGRTYLGREIARPMGHAGADWLERDRRDAEELPGRVLDAMGLADTSRVADIGAGTGYFTFRIAPRVPRGRVYAVDIDAGMLADLAARRDSLGASNVEVVRGSETAPGLDSASVDVALVVDSYHEFSQPLAMGQALKRALRPGGRLVLVEYRAEDPTVPIRSLHRMSAAQIRREMAALGLHEAAALDVLPQQHLMVFEKR